MNKPLAREDSDPWYRQFWPWFLIILPASVVVAAVSTMVIANRHADDLVVDEYYKDGLGINRELAKMERARDLGISVQLSVGMQRVQAIINGPVTDPELTLRLSHPMEADRDMTVSLQRIGDGSYSAALPAPLESRWHWVIEHGGTDGWRADGVIAPGDFTDARPD